MTSTALITGGSRGIGYAIAHALHAADHRVALLARDPDRLKQAAERLGGDTVWRSAEVSNAGQVRTSIEELAVELDGLDVLVTASGFGTRFRTTTPFDEAVAAWDDVLGVNLRGAFLTIQAAAPHLRRPGGRIITISSIAAYTGGSSPGAAAYAAAKAGLLGLARELTPDGITANAIAPGFIQTDFHGENPQQAIDAVIDQIPAGRVGQPDDVGVVAAFLASPAASYISGQVIHVNGGWWFGA